MGVAALSTAALCTDVLSASALSGPVAICDIRHARTAGLMLAMASICGLAWTFRHHRWNRARSAERFPVVSPFSAQVTSTIP